LAPPEPQRDASGKIIPGAAFDRVIFGSETNKSKFVVDQVEGEAELIASLATRTRLPKKLNLFPK
jgi:hypothetical protein